MSRALYSLALYVLAPILWLIMSLRARKTRRSWHIFSRERFGFVSPMSTQRELIERGELIWVHAVSLGETRAAHSLITALLDRGYRVLLTHMTATGRDEGSRLFESQIASGALIQAWIPYDFPGSVARFFKLHRPIQGILIEREIWPNLVHACAKRTIPIALVSARFSQSALKQSRWMSGLLRDSLQSIDPVLCQTAGDAERLRVAGARAPVVCGNLKFDVSVASAVPDGVREAKKSIARPTLAIASTREGEDQLFVDALGAQRAASALLVLLIPRHPQRFDSALAIVQNARLRVGRRTITGWQIPDEVELLIGDSLGEMAHYLGLADVAIIGGSFAPLGGQNFIEACALGIPVILGPHTFNFEPAAQEAIDAGAVLRAPNADAAVAQALELLASPERRTAMSKAGTQWVSAHVGATERIVSALSLPADPK